jgi:hypothetical protein
MKTRQGWVKICNIGQLGHGKRFTTKGYKSEKDLVLVKLLHVIESALSLITCREGNDWRDKDIPVLTTKGDYEKKEARPGKNCNIGQLLTACRGMERYLLQRDVRKKT